MSLRSIGTSPAPRHRHAGRGVLVLLFILALMCSGVALMFIGILGSGIPGRDGGMPGCESTRVVKQIRDSYGQEVGVLYRLVPVDSWRATFFFDLRGARQIGGDAGARTCLGEYVTPQEKGSLKYRITWLDATNPEDGRIKVGFVSGSSPELLARLRRASGETRPPARGRRKLTSTQLKSTS